MKKQPDPTHLEVRTPTTFVDSDGTLYNRGARVVVPVEEAWRWRDGGGCVILGPAERPQAEQKPEPQPEPTEPAIDMDSIQTPTVRVKVLREFVANDGAHFRQGQTYELPKECVRVPINAGSLRVVGPGKEPEPTETEKFQHRIAELERKLVGAHGGSA